MSIVIGIPAEKSFNPHLSHFEGLKRLIAESSQVFDRYLSGLYLMEFILIGSAYYSFTVTKTATILIIMYGMLLLMSGMIFFLYRSKFRVVSKLREKHWFFSSILAFGLFFIKIEIFLSLESNNMDLLVAGTTLLSIILFTEKTIFNLNFRLILLSICVFYILLRVLIWNSPNAFNILQIFCVGLSSSYFIVNRDRLIKSVLIQKQNICSEKKPSDWESILRDFPDSLYILDSNLRTIFSNISRENEIELTIEKGEDLQKEKCALKTGENWKPEVLKLVKELEIKGDEELAQTFFGPLHAEGTLNFDDSIGELLEEKHVSSKSTRILLTSPNHLRSSKNTETGAGTLGNLSFRNRSSRKLRSLLQNNNLLQIIELISRNIVSFHEHYDKTCLTIVGKIGHDGTSAYSLNVFNKSYPQDPRRDILNRTIEIKISPSYLKGQPVLILILSEKLQGKPLASSVQSMSEYKVNLLASFSHELRTPLNGNLNFLQAAMQRSDISEEVKNEYLSPALVSAKLLFYMISDILDYSQFGLNKISLSIKKINIRTLLQEVVELFRMQAAMKNLKIHMEILENFEIASDYTRLSQVLVTLLSNALKFTYEGSITVGVCRVNDPPKCFKVYVRDTGIGMSEMQKKKVKKILKGEDTEKVGSQSVGFNLGLTTSGRLANLLGPEKTKGIIVEPEKKGTKFSFILESKAVAKNQKSLIDLTLSEIVEKPESPEENPQKGFNRANTVFNSPMKGDDYSPIRAKKVVSSNLVDRKRVDQESTNSEIMIITAPSEGVAERVDLYDLSNTILKLKTSNQKANNEMQNLVKRTTTRYGSVKEISKCRCNSILIVDDDSFNVLAAQKLFGALGLNCMTAFHGKQAIEIIESKPRCSEVCNLFKFILMDCNMPVMDGYETTEYLKAEAMNQNIPNIPIVGCTAFVTHFDAAKCFDCGMDDYVTKPLSTEKINRILEKWNRTRLPTLGSPI